MFLLKKKKVKKKLFSKKNILAKKKKQHALKKAIFNVDLYMRDKTHEILGLWVIHKNKQKIAFTKKFFLQSVNKKIWTSQKRLRFLRHRKKSKLPLIFFQPWKKTVLHPTRKQHFLNTQYNRYKNLRFKDRIDFLQTYIGKMLLATEMYSQDDSEITWFPDSYFKWTIDLLEQHRKIHLFFSDFHKKSWWYENLIQKRYKPQSAKKFVLTRPATAFQLHWKQRKKEPWKEALLFRRALYAGFGERFRKENKFRPSEMKLYLRRKNPRSEKRNQLYQKASFLLTNYKFRFRVVAKKAARIKQLVQKIIWPFYGHLRIKQMTNIYKKSRRTKSKVLATNEVILSHFENRLDVVVYRLNFAPTILWARRLIKSGSIFVVPAKNTIPWEFMHASLKKIAFPLKLRDPKKLYSTTLWTYRSKHWATFRFLSCPQKKISYLLQPGDLIQSVSGNSLNQFKTTAQLWHKPIPTHLLANKKMCFFWDSRFQQLINRTYTGWEQQTDHLNAAIFLHTPQFRDLNGKDRIKESFFRWTIL